MSSLVQKYRMLVQARTDLSPEEIAQYEASHTAHGHGPTTWPWRETGDIIHARRAGTACLFYRAVKMIAPIIKIRAVILPRAKDGRFRDMAHLRAWRGFVCLFGSINGVEDEVKHFEVPDVLSNGVTACGIRFQEHWETMGKPECDRCLAVAVEQHPEMKEFL